MPARLVRQVRVTDTGQFFWLRETLHGTVPDDVYRPQGIVEETRAAATDAQARQKSHHCCR